MGCCFWLIGSRGQSSIEFILLVAIAMIYISTVIMPSVEISKRAASDTMQLSQARLAAEKLANTIDSVAAASGDAKATITIIVPQRALVKCLNCADITDPATCNNAVPFNAVGFDFWLTENDQTPLLENPLCPKETDALGNVIPPGKSVCSKLFRTSGNFSCTDYENLQNNLIGDPVVGVSVIAEISVEKKNGGIVARVQ